ncbi:MAG: hypothetical protein J7D61_08730 [Marichromatium sp.]|nr:hypothetical protein [Marichromatium sp.]
MNKKSQKGGDQSTNLQADQVFVQVGIDEKRAREVFQEMFLQLRREYTQEALEIANARVSEFEERLMTKMERVDGALEAFGDPSFQLLLVDAQKAAVSTERPADYDLLSELLIHRFKKGGNRIARVGISLAVDIVDKVSDEALLGLTVAHAVNSFQPATGDIHEGLDVLNNLFGKVICGDLPSGDEWLDHLDILNAVRLSSFGVLKKVQEYYPEILSGYIDVGVEKASENHAKSLKILDENKLSRDLLIDHSLNADYVRIPIVNRARIDSFSLRKPLMLQAGILVGITEGQKAALNNIYDLYSQDGELKQKNINALMEEWDKRSNLKALKDWWDAIPISLKITAAGKVLAHSNAQRCDEGLPPMD